MNPWLIGVAGTAVAVMAVGALNPELIGDFFTGGSDIPDEYWMHCNDAPLVAWTPAEADAFDGQLQVQVAHEGVAADARICVYDSHASKRLETVLHFSGTAEKTAVLKVPVAKLSVEVDTVPRSGSGQAAAGSVVNLHYCTSHAAKMPSHQHVDADGGIGGGTSSFECALRADTESGVIASAMPGPKGPGGGGTVTQISTGLGLSLLGGVGLLGWPRSRLFIFGLFTRLVRNRLLDQDVRNEIHEAVLADPGIHVRAVAQRLGYAESLVGYHVGVLLREGLFSEIRLPGARHLFLHGSLGITEMRRRAILRHEAFAALFREVEAHPGSNLGSAARSLGWSPSYTVKVSRRLARLGIIDRTQAGREVLLNVSGPSSAVEVPAA